MIRYILLGATAGLVIGLAIYGWRRPPPPPRPAPDAPARPRVAGETEPLRERNEALRREIAALEAPPPPAPVPRGPTIDEILRDANWERLARTTMGAIKAGEEEFAWEELSRIRKALEKALGSPDIGEALLIPRLLMARNLLAGREPGVNEDLARREADLRRTVMEAARQVPELASERELRSFEIVAAFLRDVRKAHPDLDLPGTISSVSMGGADFDARDAAALAAQAARYWQAELRLGDYEVEVLSVPCARFAEGCMRTGLDGRVAMRNPIERLRLHVEMERALREAVDEPRRKRIGRDGVYRISLDLVVTSYSTQSWTR